MLLFADYSTTWDVYMYLVICSSSLKPSTGQPLKYKNIRNTLYCFRTKVGKFLNVRIGNGIFFNLREGIPKHIIAHTPASYLGNLAPPQDNFSWVPNCSFGPPGWETKVSSKKFGLGYVKLHGFYGNP